MLQHCTPEEEQEFFELILQPSLEQDVRTLLQQAWDNMPAGAALPVDEQRAILNRVLNRNTNGNDNRIEPTAPHGNIYRMRSWMAAACVLVLLGLASYFFINNQDTGWTKTAGQEQPAATDIKAPVSNKARLVLGDGRVLLLDSIRAGRLNDSSDAAINIDKNGGLVYNGAVKGAGMNKLYNPRGSAVVSVTLQDGSRIWLNSGSSLQYPQAFEGNERNVILEGEAYFEVTKQPWRRFTVTAGGTTTEVLGTHFDVNAFKDMGTVNVALLEGSVNVHNSAGSEKISPGQQARLGDDGKINIGQVNLDEVMAWKNGLFYFENAGIRQVMNQVARWYDVEVLYEGGESKKHFSGIVSRADNVSAVLKLLQLAGIQCRISGRSVIVHP